MKVGATKGDRAYSPRRLTRPEIYSRDSGLMTETLVANVQEPKNISFTMEDRVFSVSIPIAGKRCSAACETISRGNGTRCINHNTTGEIYTAES